MASELSLLLLLLLAGGGGAVVVVRVSGGGGAVVVVVVVFVCVPGKIHTHYQNLKFVTLSLTLTIISLATTFTIYFTSNPSAPIHKLEIISNFHYLSVICNYIRWKIYPLYYIR